MPFWAKIFLISSRWETVGKFWRNSCRILLGLFACLCKLYWYVIVEWMELQGCCVKRFMAWRFGLHSLDIPKKASKEEHQFLSGTNADPALPLIKLGHTLTRSSLLLCTRFAHYHNFFGLILSQITITVKTRLQVEYLGMEWWKYEFSINKHHPANPTPFEWPSWCKENVI